MESDEVIMSSVKNLVQIPSECEVTSDNESECNVPVCEDSFDVLKDHPEILSDSNNDDTSSDDDAFEDIEYVEASDINRLIADIEFLNDNPTPDRVFKSSSSFPIFEKSDNPLSYLDNSLPEFETFSDHTEETRSGSSTAHANNSLPEYDSFCFENEPDQERLTSVVMTDISNNSINDPLLEEVDLFLASDNSVPLGLFAVINDEFEEWAWSCELTSFWPAAATIGIPASLWFRSYASRSQTGASQSRQSTKGTEEKEKGSRVTKNATWVTITSATSSSSTSGSIWNVGAPRDFGSQVTPPPPPPTSTNQDSPSKGSAAPSPSKTATTTEHQAWTTPDVTLKPIVSLTPEDLDMDEAMEERPTTLKPTWSIQSSDVPVPMNNWASALASNYSPPPKDSLLAQTGDITIFMDWFCKQRGITELQPQDLEGPSYEIVKVFHPDVLHLQYQMKECHKLLTDSIDDPILRHNVSKPLPLGGPLGQVTIQSDFFFNKDLEYLRYGSKGCRPALSISKIKAAYYPDAGLEQMVPDQFWIEEDTVRTHMRILSVVRIKALSMYGYDYMKKIVLRRADLNEHVIAERDFKYLYPSDFEDLNLLNLQGHLNHLPPKEKKILTTVVNKWTRQLVIRQRVEDFQLGIESYQTQVNLTKPQWTATGFEYKHDYIVIESPRAVIFWDKYGVQMMIRFNEIQKFSDGTP
nr:hypothetical protein [Tanacetum cinerariifolium]